MEEKERYSLQEFGGDIDVEIAIVDNKLCRALSFVRVKNLLNLQDKRIKELIEENKKLKHAQKQLAFNVLEELDNFFKKYISDFSVRTYVCTCVKNKMKEIGWLK